MRYERSSLPVAGARTSPRSWRALVGFGALGLAAAGGTAAAVTSSSGPGHSLAVSSPSARALEAVVVQVLALEDNLGAPEPPGVHDPHWALRSVTAKGTGTDVVVTGPAYAWVRGGALRLLSPAAARGLLVAQGADVRAVASGALRAELQHQLAAIVRGEQHSAGGLSAPGGVRVVQWYSVHLDGASASVDGTLVDFDERVRIGGQARHRTAISSVASGEIEALASLRRSGGTWRVASIDEKPFQQPT